jgi:hypothetical protein
MTESKKKLDARLNKHSYVYHILDFNKTTHFSLYFPLTIQFVQGSFVEQSMLLFACSFNFGALFLVLLSFYLVVSESLCRKVLNS